MNKEKNKGKELKPTMALRWAEMEEGQEVIPAVKTKVHVTNYYKLQQYWATEDGTDGEWQDVPTEYLPLSL